MKPLQLSKPNLTIDDLKLIAIIAMLIDHLADMITSNDSIMNLALHTVGRITAPIMFFAAVEGYHKTHNLKRYLFRLTIFALISHIPFSLMFYDGDLFRLNVIYTILFGLIAIIARHKIKNKICVLVVISLLLALSLFSDWGYFGILIMLIFDFFYRNFKLQAFAYCLVAIIDGDVLPIVLSQARILNGVFQYTNGFLIARMIGLILPIILISFYDGQKSKSSGTMKWFFYIFYPLHLIILWLIKHFLMNS